MCIFMDNEVQVFTGINAEVLKNLKNVFYFYSSINITGKISSSQIFSTIHITEFIFISMNSTIPTETEII